MNREMFIEEIFENWLIYCDGFSNGRLEDI